MRGQKQCKLLNNSYLDKGCLVKQHLTNLNTESNRVKVISEFQVVISNRSTHTEDRS